MSFLDIFDKLDSMQDKPIPEGSGDGLIKTVGVVMLLAFLLLLGVIGIIMAFKWMGGFSTSFLK